MLEKRIPIGGLIMLHLPYSRGAYSIVSNVLYSGPLEADILESGRSLCLSMIDAQYLYEAL